MQEVYVGLRAWARRSPAEPRSPKVSVRHPLWHLQFSSILRTPSSVDGIMTVARGALALLLALLLIAALGVAAALPGSSLRAGETVASDSGARHLQPRASPSPSANSDNAGE